MGIDNHCFPPKTTLFIAQLNLFKVLQFNPVNKIWSHVGYDAEVFGDAMRNTLTAFFLCLCLKPSMISHASQNIEKPNSGLPNKTYPISLPVPKQIINDDYAVEPKAFGERQVKARKDLGKPWS